MFCSDGVSDYVPLSHIRDVVSEEDLFGSIKTVINTARENSIRERKCVKYDDLTLSGIIDKRIRTKAICFEYVNQDVYHLLDHLKKIGLRLAIISNCSSEEVKVIRQSKLYKDFDQVVLSCIFIGDGLSNELEGAQMAGMKAIQAKWYTNQFPHKRDSRESFFTAEEPLDILQYV